MDSVSIGKDGHSVPIMTMANLGDAVWKKSACFDNLATTLNGQKGHHSVQELIAAMSSVLPVGTETAYSEAEAVRKAVLGRASTVSALDGHGFLNSGGGLCKKLRSLDLKDRHKDLAFFKFGCDIKGSVVDERITQSELNLVFCLKLPQSVCQLAAADPPNDTGIEGEETPAEREIDFSTPLRGSAAAGGLDASTGISPKMKAMLGLGATAVTDGTSYYGSMEFLDDQPTFDQVFGTDITLLPAIKPHLAVQSMDTTPDLELREYARACMYDVYVRSCRSDYVGEDVDSNHTLSTHEICKQVSTLKMRYRENNKWKTDDPDELYRKYLDLLPGLPNNSNTWTIQIYSSYYMALTTELKDEMISDGFIMPNAADQLGVKTKQIALLRSVRADAVRSFKGLNDKAKQMRNIMVQMGGGRQGSSYAHYEHQEEQEQNPPSSGSIYQYQSKSLAESTMSRHSDPRNPPNPLNLPTRPGKDGVPHPYRADDPGYLSYYPLGFRGCYQCGGTDHIDRKECPKQGQPQAGDHFWKELWIHKPHTKKNPTDNRQQNRDRNSSFNRYQVSISHRTVSYRTISYLSHRIESYRRNISKRMGSNQIIPHRIEIA
jgi:hypothetical protein